MHWTESEVILQSLLNSEERKEWREEGASEHFHGIRKRLTLSEQNPASTGSLLVKEIEGASGFYCWMNPIEGYPKILGPKNQVKLFDEEGKCLFEGVWGEVLYTLIENRIKLFIHLVPKEPLSRPQLGLRLKLQGYWRYLKHRKR